MPETDPTDQERGSGSPPGGREGRDTVRGGSVTNVRTDRRTDTALYYYSFQLTPSRQKYLFTKVNQAFHSLKRSHSCSTIW